MFFQIQLIPSSLPGTFIVNEVLFLFRIFRKIVEDVEKQDGVAKVQKIISIVLPIYKKRHFGPSRLSLEDIVNVNISRYSLWE